jgi:hypothetical protein
MTGKNPSRSPLAGLVALLLLLWFACTAWRHRLRRKRLLETVKEIAEQGRNEVGGRSVEHWLEVLNQDRRQTLTTNESFVFKYKGQELFFVDGQLTDVVPSKYSVSYRMQSLCFLIAVGKPAVWLLSDQEHVFRKLTGSDELAAFSVFRVSKFDAMLSAEALR